MGLAPRRTHPGVSTLDSLSATGYFWAMIAASTIVESARRRNLYPDLLENGAHLSATEFLRRYETTDPKVKAELINGIVYMASPARFDLHGEPHGLMQTLLGVYAIATPGVRAGDNATVRLGPDDVPQPDGILLNAPECGGRSRVDKKGYLEGAPELVVEVAASSASIDTHEKLISYRRAGVREYLVWRTGDQALDWWMLEEDEYRPLPAESDGVLRSRIFPGLWLDAAALLAGEGARLLAKLQEGLQSKPHADFVARLKEAGEGSRPSKPGAC
jgi:Uma2 family endonuclease